MNDSPRRSAFAMPGRPLDIAVIGAGWAGLAAAVRARQMGHAVTLYEMASAPGGRARSLAPSVGIGLGIGPGQPDFPRLDNGQHILIGAYTATLALMREVGADPDRLLWRQPLQLSDPAGRGLKLPSGHPLLAFGRGVWAHRGWTAQERLTLLWAAGQWLLSGFRCDESLSVAQLTQQLPLTLRHELIDPLCVAALNTPADEASASVFLRVLKDALFSGPGASDLLLPRRPLAELLPEPALAWLRRHGSDVRLSRRIEALSPATDGWRVDDQRHDRVILASSASEAARLVHAHAPDWTRQAQGLRFEPIITVYLHSPGSRLIAPMTTLPVDAPLREPAQFAFDQGALGGAEGLFAFVISGAAAWVDKGMAATEAAVLAQAEAVLRRPAGRERVPVRVLQSIAEKRATFRCTPALHRPTSLVAPGLWAAGDYITGPYPATLEGAVRSGGAAAEAAAKSA